MPESVRTRRNEQTTEQTEELRPSERDADAQELIDSADGLLDEIEELLAEDTEQENDRVLSFTLADAIREGASVSPQCFGSYMNEKGETCALGAAAIAVAAKYG